MNVSRRILLGLVSFTGTAPVAKAPCPPPMVLKGPIDIEGIDGPGAISFVLSAPVAAEIRRAERLYLSSGQNSASPDQDAES